ncbi:MAG TPA: dihydropteroate synthase [Alphaproteobacteria bacterium]|nr:dihydropteroate synthase [Alphaproteobacteria bacterium]
MSAADVPEWLDTLPQEERVRARRMIAAWNAPRCFPGAERGAPALMGVVNVTHDSFYAGSRRPSMEAALAEAERAAAEGAAILDVGGQSTRPGASVVSLPYEMSAVLPVIEKTRGLGLPISVDTLRPAVAEAGLRRGAQIVNDVSGLLPHASAAGAALIVGDMRGNPKTMQQWPRSRFGVFDIYARLETAVANCLTAGIPPDRIAVDPGFGFGKSVCHNQALMRHLPLFLGLGVTVAIGVSRKGSLGYWSGTRQPSERLPASLAAALAAARGGASILRVHDVAETRQMLHVFGSLA